MPNLTPEELVADSDEILVTNDRDGVRFLVINRPDARNAMSYELRREYARQLAAAQANAAVKVVVLTGVGGQFSAGVDLKDHLGNPGRPMFRPHPAEATLAFRKPIIAAVDGFCLTGGLELALSCSFIIATDRARFADTHAKIGMFPGWGLSALLPDAIGARRARQLSWTGEMIDAAKACDWGLINEVTTPEDLLPRAMQLAAMIQAANESSVIDQLELVGQNIGVPLAVALAAEEACRDRRRTRAETKP